MNDIFGEVFRSFFGLPRRDMPFDNFPDDENQHRQDGFPGGGDFFFSSRPFPFFGGIFPGMIHPDDDGDRDDEYPNHRHPSHDPFGFGMFDMFDQMRRMFEEFHIHEIPGSHRGITGPSDDSDNLRDRMLKEPDTESPSSRKQTPFFGGSFMIPDMYEHPYATKKQDTDLDEEVKKGNIDAILGSVGKQPSDGQLQPKFDMKPRQSFRSVTVHTYRNINGEIEEKKIIKDGQGNEETIVTRRVGDKRHTVTTRRDASGTEHVTETYDNIDENQVGDFNSKWNSHTLPPGGSTQRASEYDLDPDTKSIFKKLFGWDFPGSGPSLR